MVNQDLIRWIEASINGHFDTARQGKALFVSGSDINLANLSEWAELAIVGPIFSAMHKVSKVELEVHIMCSTLASPTDLYKCQKLAGIFSAAYTDIIVKKYGNDNSYVGCLRAIGRIEVTPWGKVKYDSAPTERVNILLSGSYAGDF